MSEVIETDEADDLSKVETDEEAAEAFSTPSFLRYIGRICDQPDSVFKRMEQNFEKIWRLKTLTLTDGPNRVNHERELENRVADTIYLMTEDKEIYIAEDECKYWDTVGKLYQLCERFQSEAIEPLKKALALNPKLVLTWNLLGECYCSTSKYDLAKKCFETALDIEENVLSLRNLSILHRKSAVDVPGGKGCLEDIKRGMSLARKAVNLDLTDGESWTVLGNSYLSGYFAMKQDEKYIKQAISAYKHAQKTTSAVTNPELHYNKAVALKFLDKFPEALESLETAIDIDPTWKSPQNCYETLKKYLNNIQFMTETKGRLKPRRIYHLIKTLDSTNLLDNRVNTYKEIRISDLEIGENPLTYIHGWIIWTVFFDASFPYTVGLMDKKQNVCTVTIYNMVYGRTFNVSDSLTVFNPQLSIVEFSTRQNEYNFLKVRVNSPGQLLLNKKPLHPRYFSSGEFITEHVHGHTK